MSIEPPTAASPEEAALVVEMLAAQLEEHAIPLAPQLLDEAVSGALLDDGRALILLARVICGDETPLRLAGNAEVQFAQFPLSAIGCPSSARR